MATADLGGDVQASQLSGQTAQAVHVLCRSPGSPQIPHRGGNRRVQNGVDFVNHFPVWKVEHAEHPRAGPGLEVQSLFDDRCERSADLDTDCQPPRRARRPVVGHRQDHSLRVARVPSVSPSECVEPCDHRGRVTFRVVDLHPRDRTPGVGVVEDHAVGGRVGRPERARIGPAREDLGPRLLEVGPAIQGHHAVRRDYRSVHDAEIGERVHALSRADLHQAVRYRIKDQHHATGANRGKGAQPDAYRARWLHGPLVNAEQQPGVVLDRLPEALAPLRLRAGLDLVTILPSAACVIDASAKVTSIDHWVAPRQSTVRRNGALPLKMPLETIWKSSNRASRSRPPCASIADRRSALAPSAVAGPAAD